MYPVGQYHEVAPVQLRTLQSQECARKWTLRKMWRTHADYLLVSLIHRLSLRMRVDGSWISILPCEEWEMSIRLITCRRCFHRVKLGSMSCGRCFRSTPFYNWRISHVIFIIGFFTALVFLLPFAFRIWSRFTWSKALVSSCRHVSFCSFLNIASHNWSLALECMPSNLFQSCFSSWIKSECVADRVSVHRWNSFL